MAILFWLFVILICVSFSARLIVGVIGFFYNNSISLFLLMVLGLAILVAKANGA